MLVTGSSLNLRAVVELTDSLSASSDGRGFRGSVLIPNLESGVFPVARSEKSQYLQLFSCNSGQSSRRQEFYQDMVQIALLM